MSRPLAARLSLGAMAMRDAECDEGRPHLDHLELRGDREVGLGCDVASVLRAEAIPLVGSISRGAILKEAAQRAWWHLMSADPNF